jgi:hypothetical protein
LVWDEELRKLTEPTANERERAMGFATGTTVADGVTEASRRHLLGQAMDLNFLTWVLSLGVAEQRRMRATCVTTSPLVCSLPLPVLEARAGGERHPWTSWDAVEEMVATASTSFSHGVEEHERVAPEVAI